MKEKTSKLDPSHISQLLNIAVCVFKILPALCLLYLFTEKNKNSSRIVLYVIRVVIFRIHNKTSMTNARNGLYSHWSKTLHYEDFIDVNDNFLDIFLTELSQSPINWS